MHPDPAPGKFAGIADLRLAPGSNRIHRIPIWGVAASPFSAHLNYLQDDDVADIISCGMTGATINRCAQ